MKSLKERLDAIRAEANELRVELEELTYAETLTAAQEARFNILTGDNSPIDSLAAEKRDIENRLDVLRAANSHGSVEDGSDKGAPRMINRVSSDIDIFRSNPTEIRDAALKRTEELHEEQITPVSEAMAERMESLIRQQNQNVDGQWIAKRMLVTESEAYRSAFAKGITQAQPAFTPEEVRALNEYRATEQSLTDASGGYGSPLSLDPALIIMGGSEVAPLLNVATIKPITSDVFRAVNTAGVSFAAVGEGVAVTASQATLANKDITPEKDAIYIPFSVEIQGDYPNFAGEWSRMIEEAFIDFLAAETATGASGIVGIFTELDGLSSQEVNPTTDGMLGPEDSLKVWNALPEKYRARASWFMNVTVESKLRVGADGYGSRNLSSEGIGPLLGKRVLLSDHAPSFSGTTGAANLLVLADFSKYYVVPRVGFNVELIPHVFDGDGLPKLQRGWLGWGRTGAGLVDSSSGILLQNA